MQVFEKNQEKSQYNPILINDKFIAFDKITPFYIEEAFNCYYQSLLEKVKEIETSIDSPTFQNTIIKLERAVQPINDFTTLISILIYTVGTEEIHETWKNLEPKITELLTAIDQSPEIFKRIKLIYDQKDSLSLTNQERRLIDTYYQSYLRSGADLPEDKRTKLQEIEIELAECCLKFTENMNASIDAFEYKVTDASMLLGLPINIIEEAKNKAKEKNLEGTWILTLKDHVLNAVSMFSESRELRKIFHNAELNIATEENSNNIPIITRIIELRNEKAKILGYNNFAEYIIKDRMAEDVVSVENFLEQIYNNTKPFAVTKLYELENFIKKLTPDLGFLEHWDISYYSEKFKKDYFNFNEDEIKCYFELNYSLEKIAQLFSKIFDVNIKEIKSASTWHKTVRVFEVASLNGDSLGIVYLDLFSRAMKTSGGWAESFRHSSESNPTIAVISCNFSEPDNDKPALLYHEELATIYHEFGHVLHSIFSKHAYHSLSASQVEWDFIELPSILMEEFCWNSHSLREITCHYETKESMPEILVKALNDQRNFYMLKRILSLAGGSILDLHLHTNLNSDEEICEYARRKMARFMFLNRQNSSDNSIASFDHLFFDSIGYASGFYSYLWSMALVATITNELQGENIYNKDYWLKYKEMILSKGALLDAKEMFRNLTGQNLSAKSLLAQFGLLYRFDD